MLYTILMCISPFMFFCQWFITCCLFYIYLDYRNDVRQEANSTDFLIWVQNGSKAETTCNINNVFGPGTVNDCTVQWWFKKFYKGDESLEDEEHSGRPLKVDTNHLRGSLKLLLQLHGKLPKNSCSGSSALEANWKDEKPW